MEIDQNDFKQLIGLLQKLVEANADSLVSKSQQQTNQQEIEADDGDEEPERNTVIKTVNKKAKSRGKQKEFINEFTSMKEANMHKSDSEIDKRLNKYPPTQRSREFHLINVVCRVCGKNEQVAPGLVESVNRYKCNKCCTSPG